MAEISDTTLEFFTKATPAQWCFIFSKYKEALNAKASRRSKKGDELIKMDAWYQEQLPKLIHARKERHITHEELVQLTKWKLMREKFRPKLIDLVRINTENAVLLHTKKAFKRLPNLSGAMAALTCLKGVGPASASAILAAAFPEQAPFMADESMLSTPGVETMDYTIAEYLNYADQLKKKSDFLNKFESSMEWNPHKIELALWAHFVAAQLEPSILSHLPSPEESPQLSDGEGEHTEDKSETDKKKLDPNISNSLQEEDSFDDSVTDDTQSGDVPNDTIDYSYSKPKRSRVQKDCKVGPSTKKCRI